MMKLFIFQVCRRGAEMNFYGEALHPIDVEAVVDRIFAGNEHKKRIMSIVNAALGVISSGSLIVNRMSRGLVALTGTSGKHTIKQIDR